MIARRSFHFLIISTVAFITAMTAASAAAGGNASLNRALLAATERGDLKRMHSLLRKGADPDFRNAREYGAPLLLVASTNGHVKGVSLLLRAGADANAKDSRGTPVLVAAAMMVDDKPDSQSIIRSIHVLLGQGGADPNAEDTAYIGDDRSALHMAAANGSVELARLLIRYGAEVDKRNRVGETPLFFAAARGNVGLAKLLVRYGADPNARTRFTRMTPLMTAADHGQSAMVFYLLHHGVDLRARNAFGKTPLEIARAAHLRRARKPASAPGEVRLFQRAVKAIRYASRVRFIRAF